MESLERKINTDFEKFMRGIESRVSLLENELAKIKNAQRENIHVSTLEDANKEENAVANLDDDDEVDLFGSESEEENEETKKIKEERLAAYAAKKSKKPLLIAKSNIILDIKPWDDETDMKAMEIKVRMVETDGLLWGASKLVPLAYGIHKLQISCVVEDDKVSVDWLQETIEAIEEYVQSVDIAAFNKV
ncbi:unnamed protein product [Timema podura]|uniref:Elongation factor 1-delta n=1 Tax=Timema podura TaxID=61482 RepID=A0ABN7NQ50_TIMPD|nr:unnamed protein product [Timema podura]